MIGGERKRDESKREKDGAVSVLFQLGRDGPEINSLRLQKMYDSWDEMMDAYMMGYQFWQGDLEITEDSPTKERRSYYEMLKNSGDSPYELDWNMELKKSW